MAAVCAAYALAGPSPSGPPGGRVRRPTGDAAFVAPPFPTDPRLEQPRREGTLVVLRVSITYWKREGREAGPWVAELYQAPERSTTRRALVIVLPIAGKPAHAERFARQLAGPDLSVLELHPLPEGADGGVLHTLQGTAKTLTEDVANVRRILQWVAKRDDVDPERIGLIGLSRGAIAAAIVAEMDPRLSVVLILGGADLPGLFRDSHRGVVRRLREKEVALARGDLDAAVAKAASILKNVDPATRAGRLDPRRTLLVNARWDRVILRRQALALRDAAQGSTQYWLPTGHNGALAYLPWLRALARRHFRATLCPSPVREPSRAHP